MKNFILLIALFVMSCNNQQKEAQKQYDAIKDLSAGQGDKEPEVAQPSAAPKQNFSVQVTENGKQYATLSNGEANATIHSGGKQIQLTLNGETHSLFVSIPGSEAKTYTIGGTEGGSFLFNTANEKEQFMLYGMKETLTITNITDKLISGNFNGKKEGQSGSVELRGEFKDIPLEDLGKLMKDAGH